jgi:hypothetical protein
MPGSLIPSNFSESNQDVCTEINVLGRYSYYLLLIGKSCVYFMYEIILFYLLGCDNCAWQLLYDPTAFGKFMSTFKINTFGDIILSTRGIFSVTITYPMKATVKDIRLMSNECIITVLLYFDIS